LIDLFARHVQGGSCFFAVAVVQKIEWVLRSAYGYDRSDVAQALHTFGRLPTVTLEDATIVAAFDLTEKEMDLADAPHLGKSVDCEEFVTIARKFMKAT
jgi:predicted nucleic-acid-binding protein